MLLRCTASREGKLNTFLRRELSMSSSLVSRLKWQLSLIHIYWLFSSNQ